MRRSTTSRVRRGGVAEVFMRLDGVILAAGEGKRLRPLTASVPKPLLFLPGGTLLDHHCALLQALGAERIVIVVRHLASHIERHLAEHPSAWPGETRIVHQHGPEGLLYALADALAHLRSPFLVIHGDSFLGGTLASFAQPLARGEHAIAVKLRPSDAGPSPEGGAAAPPTKDTVSVDDAGRILAFGRRIAGAAARESFGCYALGTEAPDLVREVAARATPDCDMIPVFHEILRRGGTVRAVPWQGSHVNLNTTEELLATSRAILDGWDGLSYPRPDEGLYVPPGEVMEAGTSRVQGPSWISHRATLEFSTVGPYAAVGPEVVLHRVRAGECLFLPGAMRRGVSLARGLVSGPS